VGAVRGGGLGFVERARALLATLAIEGAQKLALSAAGLSLNVCPTASLKLALSAGSNRSGKKAVSAADKTHRAQANPRRIARRVKILRRGFIRGFS